MSGVWYIPHLQPLLPGPFSRRGGSPQGWGAVLLPLFVPAVSRSEYGGSVASGSLNVSCDTDRPVCGP